MAAKNCGNRFFGKKDQMILTISCGLKNFVKITLSRTISEINAFLCFTQKFKMAAKNGGKTIFGKKWPMTLHTPAG